MRAYVKGRALPGGRSGPEFRPFRRITIPGMNYGGRGGVLPSLDKEGWLRDQEDFAKPPQPRADGVVVKQPIIGSLNEPPRPLHQRLLRDIFLVVASTPPLPRRGLPPVATFLRRYAAKTESLFVKLKTRDRVASFHQVRAVAHARRTERQSLRARAEIEDCFLQPETAHDLQTGMRGRA